MKKRGEITDIKNNIATVRIYKGDEPTSLTINAKIQEVFSVTDMVEVEINPLPFFLCVIFSYILPFITVFFAYAITSSFTDNIVIIQLVMLAVLALNYLSAGVVEKNTYFKILQSIQYSIR